MIHYRLGDIVDVISEREDSPSNSNYNKFVGLEHYVSGDVEIKKYGNTDLLKSAMKVFNAGDILIARRNVYLKRASFVNFDGITSGDSIVLRAKDEIIKKLLPFVLNTDNFWEYAEKFSDGTMSKRLSPKVLLEYEFNLPDITEQEKFAELLWAAHNTKESYNNLLSITDDLLKSRFIEMFGDFHTNSLNWEVKRFEDFAKIDAVMTTDYEKFADYPHIGIDSIEKDTGELKGYRTIKQDNVISSKYIFTSDHIIYSKIRPNLNKVALPSFEGLCSADAYPILPNAENCNKYFLATVLRSDYFLSYILSLSARTNMPKVNRKQIAGFSMPLPPLTLQEQFGDFYKQINISKKELQQTISSLKNTIRSLIQQYVY